MKRFLALVCVWAMVAMAYGQTPVVDKNQFFTDNGIQIVEVTIPNGTAFATPLQVFGLSVVAIIMPPAGQWTAADITFKASHDAASSQFRDFYDDSGAEVTVTAIAGRYIRLDPLFHITSARYLQIRSGTSATPVNQGAQRLIRLVLATR